MKIISRSEEETINIGESFAKELKRGDVVLLTGDLGAGKTRFVRGIAKGLGIVDWEKVKSPTYTIRHTYQGKIPLYHFDLYRINGENELYEIGIDDLELDKGVSVVEWGKIIENFFDKKPVIVKIIIVDDSVREIIMKL